MKHPLRMAAIFGALLLILTACTGIGSLDREDGDSMEDDERTEETGDTEEEDEDSSQQSSYPALEQLDRQKAEAYIGANINVLTKEKPAVLGGRFYVTTITWMNDGSTAVVEYEDGQKKMQARAIATIDDGDVVIVSFADFSKEE